MPGLLDCLRLWIKPAKEKPAMPTTAEEHHSRQLLQTARNFSDNVMAAVKQVDKQVDILDAELAFYRQHLSRRRPHDVDHNRGDGPGGAGDSPGAG